MIDDTFMMKHNNNKIFCELKMKGKLSNNLKHSIISYSLKSLIPRGGPEWHQRLQGVSMGTLPSHLSLPKIPGYLSQGKSCTDFSLFGNLQNASYTNCK